MCNFKWYLIDIEIIQLSYIKLIKDALSIAKQPNKPYIDGDCFRRVYLIWL